MINKILFAFLEKGMLEAMFIIRSLSFMKIIHIQLSDERREIIMLEESW